MKNSDNQNEHTQQQKKRIRELLMQVAGYEEVLRMSIADGDREFQRQLIGYKKEVYNKLRRVMYGLPEEEPEGIRAAKKG